MLPRWMMWGRLTTIPIIAIHILHPCSYGRKVGLEAGIFLLLRTGTQIPDEMVDKEHQILLNFSVCSRKSMMLLES